MSGLSYYWLGNSVLEHKISSDLISSEDLYVDYTQNKSCVRLLNLQKSHVGCTATVKMVLRSQSEETPRSGKTKMKRM